MHILSEAEKVYLLCKKINFFCVIGYMILVRNKMGRRPPTHRRGIAEGSRVYVLRMSVLYYFVMVVVLFVGYQHVAIISKKAQRTHIQLIEKELRAVIAETSPTDAMISLLQK